MTLRIYKYQVVPVLQEIDDNGNVTGEMELRADQQGNARQVYGVQGLIDYARSSEAEVAELNKNAGKVTSLANRADRRAAAKKTPAKKTAASR